MKSAEKLKAVRKHLKLSQEKMATIIGVKQSYYSEMERGEKEPSANVLKSLFTEGGISAEWFLHDKGDMFANANSVIVDGKKLTNGEFEAMTFLYDYLNNNGIHSLNKKKDREIMMSKLANLEDKGIYYHVKSTDEINATYPELNELRSVIHDFVIDVEILTQIVDIYINPVLKGTIEYTDYESYRDTRIKKIKSLTPYLQMVKNVKKPISTFISAFKKLDVENKIEYFEGD